MEQAVNTFNKGLQSDTHPMVQGNDTFSDALNATFVTMNGNEVILQNDMGNRRVDNAYLPSGYEPVGIKEYGGVIYVAAYNPITNKSQIGSFPSPERKISSEDGSGLGGTVTLSQLEESYSDSTLNGLNCIYKDTILVPLTKDTSLHAGDKFVVYGAVSPTDQITNYKNTTGNKVVSPKNKKYTLALGILNSQNEFVDITKTLTRWDGSTLIDYTDRNVSDLFKFNDGYFIASSFTNPTFDETLSDAQLIQERQTIATNTYAYKLVGPLYVKATLNHISEFNYNIYGIATNDEKTSGEIWIEAFVRYNCPDGLTTGGGSDDNYSTYAEGELSNFPVFDLKDVSGSSTYQGTISSEETKYDPNTDSYTYKIVKHYKITAGSGSIYQYVIGVQAVNGQQLYLSGLSSKGEIDISLLGSGEVKLKGWRFINNATDQTSTITYTFDAYPKYGETFQNFKFIFTNVNNTSEKHEIPANLYNGKSNLNLDWRKYGGFNPRKLYRVTWEYDVISDDGTEHKKSVDNSNSKQKDRWFLTTELFNSCYSPNSGEYIQDFGNPSENESEIMERKCSISYTFNPNFSDRSLSPVVESSGQLIKKDSDIKLLYTTTQNIILRFAPVIEYDETLYPDYISVKPTASNNIKITNIEGECDGTMDYINVDTGTPKKYTDENNPTNYEPTFTKTSQEGKVKEITGTLKNYDLYETEGVSDGTTITNGFVSLDYFLSDIMESKFNSDRKFYMTCVDWHDSAKDDGHYVNVMVGSPNEAMKISGSDGGTTQYQNRIASRENDDKEVFTLTELNSAVQEQFQNVPSQQVFIWGYATDTGNFWISTSQNRGTGVEQSKYARVWWRSSFGDFAIFKDKKQKNTTLASFVKSCFGGNNFKFAYYKSTRFSDAGIYGPNTNRYRQSSEYSFVYNISWKMGINSGDIFNISTISGFNCTYPQFKVADSQEDQDYSHQLQVKSSEEFSDMMGIIPSLNDINGIDLELGKITDASGKSLNPNNFYKANTNNELEYYSNPSVAISEDYGDPDKRTIIYNKQTMGSPTEAYDGCGSDGDSHTVLHYDKVNVVRL